MQNQIQQFLDMAEKNGGVLSNRTLPQLEETINAVSIVIKNISNE
jgi:hypothetical protein